MIRNYRVIIFVLLLGMIVLLGTIFWPLLKEYIVNPVMLNVTVFLQKLFLFIDQQYYWWFLIVLLIFLIPHHLVRKKKIAYRSELKDRNATLQDIDTWKTFIRYQSGKDFENISLKRKLVKLLSSMYASKHYIVDELELYNALKKRHIKIPDEIYDFFLLSDETFDVKPWTTRLMQSIRSAPRKWRRKFSGQDIKDYYQSIGTVLEFMETSMEDKHENRHIE